MLKDPQPLPDNAFIAGSADERVSVTVDWVIFRDGPGTWVRDADWDEYLVTVTNNSNKPVTITGAIVVDSMSMSAVPEMDRKILIKASGETVDRYNDDGLTIEAGASGTELIAAGAAVGAAGAGLATAAMFTTGAGVGAAAATGILAAPVLLGVGITKGLNNSKVAGEIETRQASLPQPIAAGESRRLHFFFPLAPSPQRFVLTYTQSRTGYAVEIDTRATLRGLHVKED